MSDELIQLMRAQNATLTIIAEELVKLVELQRQSLTDEGGPNYRRQLHEYATFDWFGIGANPTREVGDGINEVSWGGYTWWRRSGTGKFGNAIWFSRAIGKNEDNTPKYARLITFKDSDAPEPLRVQVGQPSHIEEITRDFHNEENAPTPINGLNHNQVRATPPINPSADGEYREYKNRPEPPMSEAQAVASAQTAAPPDPKEAETTFYSLVKDAIRSGKVSAAVINQFVKLSKQSGWPTALKKFQHELAAIG